jgi:hypothetical protein
MRTHVVLIASVVLGIGLLCSSELAAGSKSAQRRCCCRCVPCYPVTCQPSGVPTKTPYFVVFVRESATTTVYDSFHLTATEAVRRVAEIGPNSFCQRYEAQ